MRTRPDRSRSEGEFSEQIVAMARLSLKPDDNRSTGGQWQENANLTGHPGTRPLGVSIIIPNFNYARFLREAIDSALAQTHELVQVIVVDDGSTDESRAVIEGYGERVAAIHQANAGQTEACLRGLALVRHEIVLFLDSDDRLLPEAAAVIAGEWSPALAKLQYQLQTIDAAGRPIGSPWPKFASQLDGATVRGELLRTGGYHAPPTSGNAYARRFLEAAAPLGGHRFVDLVLNTVAPLYGETCILHRVLAEYRSHGANNGAAAIVDAERFARFAENERQKVAILETHCRRLGIPFEGRAIIERSLWMRELELVRAKLDAGALGVDKKVLRHGIAAMKVSLAQPEALGQRLLRAAWSASLMLAPRPLANRLVATRFDQTARPQLVDRVVGLLSARAAPGRPQRADTAV